MINSKLLDKWINKQDYNPFTKKRIKLKGKTWTKLMLLYEDYCNNVTDPDNDTKDDNILVKEYKIIDNYKNYRNKKIDPLNDIKIHKDLIFSFPYKWDNFTGNILEKDINGSINFDCHNLVYYFYINRLNNLWNITDDNLDGYYGDALNNGNYFRINGRGNHPEWYLFRLPLIDCYIPEKFSYNYITMGPILSYDNIVDIYIKAEKKKKVFFNKFKIKLPNLLKIYELYHDAINVESLISHTQILMDAQCCSWL